MQDNIKTGYSDLENMFITLILEHESERKKE